MRESWSWRRDCPPRPPRAPPRAPPPARKAPPCPPAASLAAMSEVIDRPRFGTLLRDWRRRRRLSQLDLAYAAGVSPRHVSFIETGRSRPSAAMVIQLAEQLEMPLRDRNALLLAAGHAPAYGQHGLEEPQMEPVRGALDHLLAGHE